METNIFKYSFVTGQDDELVILPRVSEFIKLTMLSILLNPVTLACLCFCPANLALLSLLGLRSVSDRGMYHSKGGEQRKTFLPSANNFMVIHPEQFIIDKNIGERLSTAYFSAPIVGNAVKGLKKCGIETHNHLVLSEHDFSASKATDHDVVGDETENNSANPQTLVVENQHINPPEEPEFIANADYDAIKKPVSVFLFQTIA
ncbi:uncharacterized protein TNCV_2854611 [Trichonephila clavipes]|nr:uncharacterized protein TNCV_2854611 [Trichonephila clavipes]